MVGSLETAEETRKVERDIIPFTRRLNDTNSTTRLLNTLVKPFVY